jgi:hypothetical protein
MVPRESVETVAVADAGNFIRMKPNSIPLKIPAYVLVALATLALLAGTLLAATTMSADSGAIQTGSRAPYIHLINLYDRDGKIIDLKTSTVPYSPATTCGKCHDVETISHGWHFNASDPAAAKNAGRPGEPWILTDAATGTQLPLTDRHWPGTFTLKDAGVTPWQFTKTFGARTPGGGISNQFADATPDPHARFKISGKLENDCLICHSADRTYNFVERAHQIDAENFMFAPTVAAGLGEVKGQSSKLPDTYDPDTDVGDNPDVPVVAYDKSRADSQNRVRFNVTRTPTAETCYACHSVQSMDSNHPRFQHDKDVHMARGFTCTDCHRDAIDHMISRGYPGENKSNPTPFASTLSCQGCHLGVAASTDPMFQRGGRMGAPHPLHRGLPPIHFEKLSCTACHSGEYPEDATHLVETSMAHRLGIPSEHRTDQTLPHIVEPLFLIDNTGKIAPHRAVWPAYWGRLNAKDQTVKPIPPADVATAVGDALPKPANAEAYDALTTDQVSAALAKLATDASAGEPVYIAGGKMYRRGADGKVTSATNPAAAMVSWPIAHDVRPAAQALGAKSCTECHAANAPIYMSTSAATTWPQAQAQIPTVAVQTMAAIRGDEMDDVQSWALAFRGRPYFKAIAIACGIVIAAVLLTNACRGLFHLLTLISGNRPNETQAKKP